MATKDPLKKLMRRFPAPAELEGILASLDGKDDRTTVIVGASVLEALLERFIQRRLAFCDNVLAGQLFYNRGPLSDFHGKIIVAQACGYLPTPLAKELLLIKSIRNAFAHTVVGISFDTPEVREKMDQSLTLQVIFEVIGPRERPQFSTRVLFALVVRLIAISLDHRFEKPRDEETESGKSPEAADMPKTSNE